MNRPFHHSFVASVLTCTMIASVCAFSAPLAAQTARQSATTTTTARRTPSSPASRPSARQTSTLRTTPVREDGIKLLKLGNTYRETRQYDLAQKTIQRGLDLVKAAGLRYWEATGYEYLGLVYRDMGDTDAALGAFQRSSDILTTLVRPIGTASISLSNTNRVDANPQTRTRTNTAQMLADEIRRGGTPIPRLRNDVEQQRALNKQLSDKLTALETKIQSLEQKPPPPTPGGGPPTAMTTTPGALARTLPARREGDKPQGEFSPFQTDKKPLPVAKPVARIARDSVMRPEGLPKFVLQIGVGVGYNLHTKEMVNASTSSPLQLEPTSVLYTGDAPLITFPLISVSGDFFLSPQFSIGLMYGYYPGPNKDSIDRSEQTTFQAPTAAIPNPPPLTNVSTTATTTITSYHLVTLRAAYHFIRNYSLDTYAGLAVGLPLSALNFQPLRLYGGVYAGAQVNVSRQVGVFVELSGGAVYVGNTATENATFSGNPLIQFGAYGRLGLAIGF
jgi:tetratricopeptide (TPR) repeat protein